MYSLKAIIDANFLNVRKHFLLLFFLCFVNSFLALAPKQFWPDSGLLLLLCLIPLMVVQVLIMIGIYQLFVNGRFDFTAAINLFGEKFVKWMWVDLYVIALVFRSAFPFLFPSLKKIYEYLFAPAIAVFENDTHIDAVKKSTAIVDGKAWKIFAILASCGLVPIIFNKLIGMGGLPSEINFLLELLTYSLVSTFTSGFVVTMWILRTPVAVVQPEAEPVDYKNLFFKSIPGALLGLLWLVVVTAIITVITIMIMRK